MNVALLIVAVPVSSPEMANVPDKVTVVESSTGGISLLKSCMKVNELVLPSMVMPRIMQLENVA
jgi:hypothetical protein